MVLAYWAGGMPSGIWAPISPITVLANHSNACSVTCYEPDLAYDVRANHSIAGSAKYEFRPAP